jgi:hypothetical protein
MVEYEVDVQNGLLEQRFCFHSEPSFLMQMLPSAPTLPTTNAMLARITARTAANTKLRLMPLNLYL